MELDISMKNVKILDVTLRDGGCVNDFNFGQTYIEKILNASEMANIDIIELGYIDCDYGSISGRTKFLNEKTIYKTILKKKNPNISYVAMIDLWKFDVNALEDCHEDGIDGIRLAFHKHDMYDMVQVAKKILEKGYDLYIQPMITLRYSDQELLQLVQLVNEELSSAKALYIVDSFGEMRINDVSRIMSLVDHNLIDDISIGFHSHNNLQLSYANAIFMLQFESNRTFIIDSSIMGMGKGAGNLNTELLAEHLNLYYKKEYNIFPLMEVIDQVINQIHAEVYWGYAPEYYLSSINHCTPSYAHYFYEKHMLPIDQVSELLGLLSEEKKISFDKKYAEEIYKKYNTRLQVDDNIVIEAFKEAVHNSEILLIAPGKSIIDKQSYIDEYIRTNQVITIGLNVVGDWNLDYILVTRADIYKKAIDLNQNVLVTSNIARDGMKDAMIIDYKRWADLDGQAHDSSSVIAFNLLKYCEVAKISLAGFDGFSQNINENYYDLAMRHPISEQQTANYNKYYAERIKALQAEGIIINFLTSSKYEQEN